MKAVLMLLCLAVAVHGESCVLNDVTTCVNTNSTCLRTQILTCEHSQCKCAMACLTAVDCATDICSGTEHCRDNACNCDEQGGSMGGDWWNRLPGSHHGDYSGGFSGLFG